MLSPMVAANTSQTISGVRANRYRVAMAARTTCITMMMWRRSKRSAIQPLDYWALADRRPGACFLLGYARTLLELDLPAVDSDATARRWALFASMALPV